jgi:hypothetical protein
MSGHHPWRDIKRRWSRSRQPAALQQWRNHVATVEVPEEVADAFVDELLAALPGASAAFEPIGTLRRFEVTIEATMTKDELLAVIGEIIERIGADMARARIAGEYAWERD